MKTTDRKQRKVKLNTNYDKTRNTVELRNNREIAKLSFIRYKDEFMLGNS